MYVYIIMCCMHEASMYVYIIMCVCMRSLYTCIILRVHIYMRPQYMCILSHTCICVQLNAVLLLNKDATLVNLRLE
jgi:hypothetical protein